MLARLEPRKADLPKRLDQKQKKLNLSFPSISFQFPILADLPLVSGRQPRALTSVPEMRLGAYLRRLTNQRLKDDQAKPRWSGRGRALTGVALTPGRIAVCCQLLIYLFGVAYTPYEGWMMGLLVGLGVGC